MKVKFVGAYLATLAMVYHACGQYEQAMMMRASAALVQKKLGQEA
jgi:hypothetical protein